jgi:hypothetical protein
MARAGRVSPSADSSYRVALWGLLAVGVLGRALLAFDTRGVKFDLDSLQIVARALVASPSHVYRIADSGVGTPRWPYLPGFFPVILAGKGISGLTGIGFETVIRFAPILADAAIAWVVQDFLRARGAGFWTGLSAVALVALGPSFAAISGVHGDLDSVAILPAVIALSVWERGAARRALIAGLLIGLGASIKTVPALMLLALLPSARSWREGLTLIATAGAVVLAALAPYLVHDGLHWFRNLDYNGGVGLGSLSLVAQPDLALNWLHLGSTPLSGLSRHLLDESRWIVAIALTGVSVLLFRRRVVAPVAAVLLWLTVYGFGVTFFMQYMVWGLPFLLMAGYLWSVLALEVVLLAPVLVIYHGVRHAWAASVFYVAPMIAVWAVMVAALLLWAAGRWPGRPGTPSDRQPPFSRAPSSR